MSEITAHKIVTENPPVASSGSINDRPESLWNRFEQQGNIIGKIDDRWQIIFPDNQYIPEDNSESVHFMISPRDEDFKKISTLTSEELNPATRLALSFLKTPETLVTYNVSEDDDKRKQSSQTWKNFHIHFLKFPHKDKLEKIEKHPISFSEPFNEIIDDFLSSAFTKVLTENSMLANTVDILSRQQKNKLGLFVKAGVVFSVKDNISNEVLSDIIKDFDTAYKLLHRDLFSLFVSNYEQVEKARWKIPYELRDQEEIFDLINKTPMPKNVKRFAKKFAVVLKEENKETNNNKKLFMSPTYSVAISAQDNDLFFTLQPHLFRKAGVTEIMGIQLERINKEGASIENRRKRAIAWISKLLPT